MINQAITAAVQNQIGSRNAVTQLLPLVGALVENGVANDVGMKVITDYLTLQGAAPQVVTQLHAPLNNEWQRIAAATTPSATL